MKKLIEYISENKWIIINIMFNLFILIAWIIICIFLKKYEIF